MKTLALIVLLGLSACGGAAEESAPEASACTYDASTCAYLAYLNAHVHNGVVDCDVRQGGCVGEAGASGQ